MLSHPALCFVVFVPFLPPFVFLSSLPFSRSLFLLLFFRLYTGYVCLVWLEICMLKSSAPLRTCSWMARTHASCCSPGVAFVSHVTSSSESVDRPGIPSAPDQSSLVPGQKMLLSNINSYGWHPFIKVFSWVSLNASINCNMNFIRGLLACNVFWDVFESQQFWSMLVFSAVS